MKKNIIKGLLLFALALFFQNGAYADFSFNDMELKFAQVSDVHISEAPDTSYKVLSHSKELLNATVKELNKIKGLDFVVFTGDMVNEPTKQLYKEFFISLTDLDYPALLVFGNHDSMNTSENEEYIDKSLAYQIIQKCNPYQAYGSPFFAYSPNKDYRIIVLDTTMGYEHQSNGYLTDEQANFLNSELAANQDKVIIIFQHHPVIEPFKSQDHRILNSNAYLDILSKYQKTPIAIFSGHYHAAKIIRKGNVIHISTPALVTYPNAFRTVSVTNYNDRVVFKFNFHETKLKEIQEISKSGIIASTVFSGLPSDRNNEFMIRKGFVPKEKLTKDEIRAKKIEQQNQKEERKLELKTQKEDLKNQKQAIKQAKKEAKKEAKEVKKARKSLKNSED